MKRTAGELILTEKYTTIGMKVNHPVPWVGMPVYHCEKCCEKWNLIEGEGHSGFATTCGRWCVLNTYRERDPESSHSNFVLPGTSAAPLMEKEFTEKLAEAYPWGKPVKYVDGVWIPTQLPSARSEAHTVLILPRGLEMVEIFPNNKATVGGQELKKLNTDGRTTCAKCGAFLAQLWVGATNLNYCTACEG